MRLQIARNVLALLCLVVQPAVGQQTAPEIVRGRVTDDSAHAVAASIKVTRGPDRLTLDATTDSTGHYSVRFEQGTGDYLVYVSAPGFKTARRRVQRQADEHELVADFVLARDLAKLDTVKVTAVKPERASNLTTLNGMAMAAGAIPRAAHTDTRVTGATFDATRGGFSGANIDVRLSPGSREFQQRRAFLTLDPPALQFTDAWSGARMRTTHATCSC